ncbi:MAG: hypothetical protein HKP27_15415 [Myxococcales bacterium]|nr:hypothetical protein [Myxococcales bacterium]
MTVATLGGLIFFPLLAAIAWLGVELMLRGLWARAIPTSLWWSVGFAASVVNAAIAGLVWSSFEPTEVRFQLVEYARWLPDFGANYLVGVDGLSLLLSVFVAGLSPLVWLRYRREICAVGKSYAFFLLAFETTLLGTLLSLNLLLFYVFWELSLLSMALLSAGRSSASPREAVLPFAGVAAAGSLPMLLAILVLASLGPDAELAAGRHILDFIAPVEASGSALRDLRVPTWGEAVWWKTQPALFAAFVLAFVSRSGLFPLHVWLIPTSTAIPRSAAVMLMAALPLLGIYGLLRFAIPMFPESAFAWSPVLVAVATVGLLYGALIALVERDPRRIAVYVSLAALHLAIIGLFSLSGEGFEGATAFLLTYGIAVAGLLFAIDRLGAEPGAEPAEERPIEPAGLSPFSLIMLVGVAFAMGGLPGSGGFVSQLLVLLGSYSVYPVISALATLGLGLLIIVLLRLVRRVSSAESSSSRFFRVDEGVVLLAALVPTLWIGLYPEPVLRRLHPSVLELCAVVETKVSSETLEKHGWRGCH